MNYQELGFPCRNFCIFASETFMDPKDNRRKYALSSFVAGGTGVIAIIDIESGEGEGIEIPADEGAWALYCWNNERLLIGTCAKFGYLHCLDLKTRTWLPSLRDENERYFWNLVPGSDGRVYGGTWPGGVLLRYDPKSHKLENMGRMSPEKDNNYTRPLYNGADGKIFLTSGYKSTHMVSWDMEKEECVKFGKDGAMVKDVTCDFVCGIIDKTKEIDFYNPYTLEQIEDTMIFDSIELSNIKNDFVKKYLENFDPKGGHGGPNVRGPIWEDGKSKCGRAGQSYYVEQPDGTREYHRIPIEAPPTSILTVAYDGKGKIWGASGLGQTIFNYDIKTGDYENTLEVAVHGGEVYGICPIEDRIYLTSYCGGEHVVYYPEKQWIKGENPKTIKTMRPTFIRPHTRSFIGSDGNVWTGWWADYGTYGGGISRINTKTEQVDYFYDIIPGQAVESLAVGEKHVFFATMTGGNGLPKRDIPVWLAAIDYSGNLVWKKEYDEELGIGKMVVLGDYLFVRIGEKLEVFDVETMDIIKTISLPINEEKGLPLTFLLKYDDETVVVFHCGEALFINKSTFEIVKRCETFGNVHTSTIDDEGNIYFSKGALLCKLSN